MAKIVRYNGNLVPFASSSLGTERTLFGEVTQADDITSQYTADFLRGWGIVGPSDQPTLQDFNAVSYTHGQILSYLHQVGVAEYNATQEYHLDSMVNVDGFLYSSLTNTNIGNSPATSPAFWKLKNGSTGIPGESLNLKCSITTASAIATFTADYITVLEVSSGKFYRRSTFNKTADISGTGVGKMDTGAAPVSGYVATYAIYNPTTDTDATLSQNATAAVAPETYTGAFMPAGYTASALISVLPTNGSSQFKALFVQGRNIFPEVVTLLSTTTPQGSFVSLNISTGVPKNAKTLNANMIISGSVNGARLECGLAASASPSNLGNQTVNAGNTLSGIGEKFSIVGVPLITEQVVYYFAAPSSGSLTGFIINAYGYSI